MDEEKKSRLVTGNSKLAFVGRTGRVAGKETAVVLGPHFEFHPATSSPAKSNFTTSAGKHSSTSTSFSWVLMRFKVMVTSGPDFKATEDGIATGVTATGAAATPAAVDTTVAFLALLMATVLVTTTLLAANILLALETATIVDKVVVAGVAFVTAAFVLAFAFILAAEDAAAAAASKAFWACIC
uniref:Uncharacterized protein n=1 Tax=Glossina pallidipes TaxID=7398 RepID=A0A1A9ZIP9_GLOPL